MPEVVDAHVHLGKCRVFGRDQTDEQVLTSMDVGDIGLAIVQPYPGAPDARQVHDDIAALAARSGGRIVGLASFNPHRDAGEYHTEIARCVNDLGFVGVKLHTIGHAVDPASADAETVFVTARELGIPVMVHTGPGLPFADPTLVLARARAFPEVTIILGHAGHGIVSGNAVAVAEVCDNIVLETSWCRPGDIGGMIQRLGPERVMFGTDSPSNVATELAKYASLGLDDDARSQVLEGTARRVFRLG